MKICIIGKSKRFSVLEKKLKEKNYNVRVITLLSEITDNITDDIVVLPIPTLNKDGFINLNDNNTTTLDSLLNNISNETTVITCGCQSKIRKVIDLNNREDFTYLNAIPTAEGAIYYALENSDISLYESKILITGFGHVAKILANRLKGLSNQITISARSLKDISYANALSFDTIKTNDLKEKIVDFDIIFQTVPSLLLTKDIIDNMKTNSMIVELSSKSIGTDFKYAKTKEINVVHAPALPEKISPITAGNILTKSVFSIIDEFM